MPYLCKSVHELFILISRRDPLALQFVSDMCNLKQIVYYNMDVHYMYTCTYLFFFLVILSCF